MNIITTVGGGPQTSICHIRAKRPTKKGLATASATRGGGIGYYTYFLILLVGRLHGGGSMTSSQSTHGQVVAWLKYF